jgi:hypothetical protein
MLYANEQADWYSAVAQVVPVLFFALLVEFREFEELPRDQGWWRLLLGAGEKVNVGQRRWRIGALLAGVLVVLMTFAAEIAALYELRHRHETAALRWVVEVAFYGLGLAVIVVLVLVVAGRWQQAKSASAVANPRPSEPPQGGPKEPRA